MRVRETIFLVFSIIVYIQCHKRCGGARQPKEPHFSDAYGEQKRFLQSTAWAPIRIYVDYSVLETQTTIDPAKLAAVKAIVNQVADLYKKVVNVKPVPNKLVLTQKQCEGQTFASSLSSAGTAADIVILPYFDLKADPETEAYALFCEQDSTTGRPLSGLMAFTNNLKLSKNYLEYNSYLIFHEIAHILIFNGGLFSSFIDSNGAKLSKSRVVANSTVNGMPRTKIITPKVVAAARKHFGCDTLDGVELENQGGDGTQGSHWEARMMMTDFMMGKSYDEIVISDITFALYEDSGWYQMNYYTGGLFRWGKSEGCGFVNSKCLTNSKSNFPKEFCDTNGAAMCTNGRISKGSCGITTSNTVDPAYQYFGDSKTGGDNLADFCPVANSEDVPGWWLGRSCVFGNNDQYPAGLEESISSTSACFISNLVNTQNGISGYTTNRAICYQFSCDSTAKTLTIMVGSKKITCPSAGGAATTDGYNGSVICPDYATFCTSAGICSSMVDCINKGITAGSGVPGGSTSSSGSGSSSSGSSSSGSSSGSSSSGSSSGSGSGGSSDPSSSGSMSGGGSSNSGGTSTGTSSAGFLKGLNLIIALALILVFI